MGSITQGDWGDCPGELHLPLPKGGFSFQRAGYQSTLHPTRQSPSICLSVTVPYTYTPKSQDSTPTYCLRHMPQAAAVQRQRQRGPYLKRIIAIISSCVITPVDSYRNRDLRRETSASFSHCLAPKLLFLNTELSRGTFPTVKGVG